MFHFHAWSELMWSLCRPSSVILTGTTHRLHFQERLFGRDRSYVILNADKISMDFKRLLAIRTMKQLDNCFSSLFRNRPINSSSVHIISHFIVA